MRIPPSGILQLKTESGTIKIATNQTSYLTQLLFWNGYKSFEYSEIFEKLAKKVSVFLDIGSNIGYYALLAVNANPKIQVYAFEPAFGPKYYLKKNIIVNNFDDKIIPVEVALSNTSGEIDFYEVDSIKYKSLKHNLAGEGNAGTKTTSRNFNKNIVSSITLQSFVYDRKLESIDLIKIDTEGTEIDILISGREVIKKYQPIIICETLFNTIEDELESYFDEQGYDYYNHYDKGLKQVTTIKRKIDNGIRNCFFVPKSKTHLIDEFIY